MIMAVLLASLIVMLVSLLGVVFINRVAKDFLEKHLASLVSFSAGVFLVTAGGLSLEVFHLATSTWFGILTILTGYVLAFTMHRLLPETHHHHDTHCERSHFGAKRLIVGDSIHNIADGIILVTAFSVSLHLGVAVTISVIIHEALQEISEFFVLKQAGYSTATALVINFATASTILVGVLFGYFALASSEVEILLLGVSAGFFIHVVIHDLLPKRAHHENKFKFLHQIILVIVGALIMSLTATFLAGEHEHGGEAHDDHSHEEHEGEEYDHVEV